jgi:hypothetical protein
MRQSRHAPLIIGIAVVAVGAAALLARRAVAKRRPRIFYDYSGRSGFPRGAEQSRGIAADVARASAQWMSRPGRDALPTSKVRAMSSPHPASPAA